MPEHILTRSSVSAEAMQFAGTQKSYEDIQEWIQQYSGEYVVNWNGNDEYSVHDYTGAVVRTFAAYPGYIEIIHQDPRRSPAECMAGDWVIKSSRDTFYTSRREDFDEIWVVMH